MAGWERLEPSVAINSVQINADPYYYMPFRAASWKSTTSQSWRRFQRWRVQRVGRREAGRQELQTAMDNGTLEVAEGRYAEQITNMANGTAMRAARSTSGCCSSSPWRCRVRIGLSDLNRQCTGSLEGAGAGSAHWVKGGGYAVDFFSINGSGLGNEGPRASP